jgi:cystathionine beta-lyase/cystathionine gamma-synthase
MSGMNIQTKAVHAGDRKKAAPSAVPVTTPIYTAASFYYDEVENIDRVFEGNQKGYAYTRYDNPTVNALEELITDLESGFGTVACSSGMAALHLALLACLHEKPRRVLCAEAIYGATVRLLSGWMAPSGVAVEYCDIFDLRSLEAHLERFQPTVLLIESISNPTLRVPEIDKISAICRARGIALMVDSTFATPLLMRPIELGADYTVHSLTKFLSGHGDVMGGSVTTTEANFTILKQISKTLGVNLGPFEAYLSMRGIKTFPLRVERQCLNARKLADALAAHPRIKKVNHPGRPDHQDHDTAHRLMPGCLQSALVSFEVNGAGRREIFSIMDRLRLAVPATSLGDVHTLVLYPVMASHRDLTEDQKVRLGINESLLRVSAGIESADDIIQDFVQALA